MTVTTHQISGTTLKPDLSDVNYGNWTIGIYSDSGYAFIDDPDFDDGTWVGGFSTWTTLDDGSLTISLPETDGTNFSYTATFRPFTKGPSLGPFPFNLTADKTWTDIMTDPSPIPITPADLEAARGYAEQAAAAASLAAWTPGYAYVGGMIVQAPDGLAYQALDSHTAATTWPGDQSHWISIVGSLIQGLNFAVEGF